MRILQYYSFLIFALFLSLPAFSSTPPAPLSAEITLTDGSRFKCTLQDEDFYFKTDIGVFHVPISSIASMERPAGAERFTLRYLNGDILTGNVTHGELDVYSENLGKVPIEWTRIQSLVIQKTAAPGSGEADMGFALPPGEASMDMGLLIQALKECGTPDKPAE